ncbi:MAG: AAA family ATPase, partial [Paraclostridium sp.]
MAIELPTTIIKPNSQNPNKLIIFSPPKHGKTTLVSALDNCLLIDLENGSDYVSALKVKVNSLTELQELGTEIMKAGRPYKYVAIDTIT